MNILTKYLTFFLLITFFKINEMCQINNEVCSCIDQIYNVKMNCSEKQLEFSSEINFGKLSLNQLLD